MPLELEPDLPVIDAHVHIGFGETGRFNWFPFTKGRTDFFRYLETVGVGTFVAFPHVANGDLGADEKMRRANEAVFKLWRRRPGLVVPAVRLHPNFPDESVREMEKYRPEGVVFAGEFVTYGGSTYNYETPGFEQIVEAAADLRMILNCHLVQREEPLFERFIEGYPDVVFILAHLWDNRDMVMTKCELVARHPNAMVDLSGYGVDRLGIWEYVANTLGAEKALWGSDYPINDPAIYLARLASCRVKAADRRKIAAGNVLRLLKERGAPLPEGF